MPLSVCEPNVWYLVFKCKRCGTRQPMHRDYSDGKAELLRDYFARCAMCAQIDTYKPEEIERYHHSDAVR